MPDDFRAKLLDLQKGFVLLLRQMNGMYDVADIWQ